MFGTYEADSLEALPGEAVAYSTRIENPPPGLVGMVVTFATRDEAKMLMDSKKDADEDMSNDAMDESMSKDESMEETSSYTEIDGRNISEWFFDQIEEYLINALEGSGILSKNEANVLGYSLEIPDPVFEFIIEGTDTTLVINGIVKNTVTETVRIPKLKGALVNSIEEEIIVWVFEADHAEVKAGETVSYSTRVINPPTGLVGMTVTFVGDEEAKKLPDSWKY